MSRAAPNRKNAANTTTPGIRGQRASTASIAASKIWITAVSSIRVLNERRAPMDNVTMSNRANARLRCDEVTRVDVHGAVDRDSG